MPTHVDTYFEAAAALSLAVRRDQVEAMVERLASVRAAGGRLFVLGVGGGAAHASHAVNDFRKLCAIETYAPSDNVAELTARTNDEGWETSYVEWLRVSRVSANDAVMVFSVGGGSREHGVSMNLVTAVEHAKEVGAAVLGVVGSAEGTTAKLGDVVVVVEAPPALKTPLVESLQAVVWHALVSHPGLAAAEGKWESVEAVAGR
jgi:D-sedoheptulose 7-phosphate isomerase